MRELSKDNHRTIMIQELKSKINELELIIDVLKEDLMGLKDMNKEDMNIIPSPMNRVIFKEISHEIHGHKWVIYSANLDLLVSKGCSKNSDECLVATIVMFASGAINEGQDYNLSGAKKHSGATLFRCQPFYARKEFLR
jgi:hypothetical protein